MFGAINPFVCLNCVALLAHSCLFIDVNAFSTLSVTIQRRYQYRQPHRTSPNPSPLCSNRLDEDEQQESEEERKRLMEQVRSVQDIFYSSPSTDDVTLIQGDTIENLPIYRKVGQTELPGRGTLVYVADSRYTHMFETIVRGPQPWFVGQVYLAGENFDDVGSLYSWKESIENGGECAIGTLLRIQDYRRVNDGRMVLWVHGLERFVVTNVTTEKQQTYPIADVCCVPDTEDMERGLQTGGSRIQTRRRAMEEVLLESKCEFKLPGEGEISVEDLIGADLEQFMPLASFSPADKLLPFVDEEKLEEEIDSISLEWQLEDHGITNEFSSFLRERKTNNPPPADLEKKLWIRINEYVNVRGLEFDVIPRELIKLLPPGMDWPEDFGLQQYALDNNYLIDVDPPPGSSPEYLSHRVHRRQRRLSYAATVLLGGMARSTGLLNRGMRQKLLEVPSTIGRLWAVLDCFDEFFKDAGYD